MIISCKKNDKLSTEYYEECYFEKINNYLDIKSIIESKDFDYCYRNGITILPNPKDVANKLHPNMSLSIKLGGKIIGVMLFLLQQSNVLIAFHHLELTIFICKDYRNMGIMKHMTKNLKLYDDYVEMVKAHDKRHLPIITSVVANYNHESLLKEAFKLERVFDSILFGGEKYSIYKLNFK